MSEDQFFERLRGDARPLVFEPDDFMATRITSRVRGRIASQTTVAGVLARWFRPLAASMTALALAATVGIVWIDRAALGSPNPAVEAIAANNNPVEIAVGGDIYSVNP
jgi:hypothetical protein